MKIRYFFLAALILLSIFGSNIKYVNAYQQNAGRLLYLTLIPNYEKENIQFDGKIEFNSPSNLLDLVGLPLNIEREWKDSDNPTWNIMGMIEKGELTYDPDQQIYHLIFGPIDLQPYDKVKFIFPYVNLNYSKIQPCPDVPDRSDEISRQFTHRFSYSAGGDGRRIDLIDIPFWPVAARIDLILTPLMGETLTGTTNGFRLSGKVRFDSFNNLDEFSRYCQDTAHRLQHGDYRMAHLLYTLDYPYYSESSGLNPAFQLKPTTIALRSELLACQYDQEQKTGGQVDAAFSGRVYRFYQSENFLPVELQGFAFPDGNYPFIPSQPFKGVKGYEIRLGKIVLGPGDVLSISMPHTQIQVDSLYPIPDNLIYLDVDKDASQIKISYVGPATFELSLPYIPQTQLYISQFPSNLRPTISLVETQFGNLISSLDESWLTWIILSLGILLLIFSRSIVKINWLVTFGRFLIAVGFFYGVRGSFGLIVIALALNISQVVYIESPPKSMVDIARKIGKGLLNLVLIAVAIHFDREGANIFRGLSDSDLSPLTPVVLLVLVGVIFLLYYGRPKNAVLFRDSDLPALALFLTVFSLYDAFDKSLLALSILFAGGLYITNRVSRNDGGSGSGRIGNKFGKNLQSRLNLAFGNRIIPFSILILIVFALGNDLSSTYANEMQISIAPLIAPLVIPLLVFVSIFLTFTGIALLFILVYPFLPSKVGYIKAATFAAFLFLVFFFGIGTDNRLIASLPNILVGRVIYYFSVPMLIGIYFDIHEFTQKENKRRSTQGKDEKGISFQSAGSMYFKNLQSVMGTLAGILSLVAPSIYAFLSSQPVIVTYFSLLEKLVLLPI